jgi:hypothetical protein
MLLHFNTTPPKNLTIKLWTSKAFNAVVQENWSIRNRGHGSFINILPPDSRGFKMCGLAAAFFYTASPQERAIKSLVRIRSSSHIRTWTAFSLHVRTWVGRQHESMLKVAECRDIACLVLLFRFRLLGPSLGFPANEEDDESSSGYTFVIIAEHGW